MTSQKTNVDTRQRLIDVALRLFAEKGYENVSMDELVRVARVTKGAFYHYFGSKEQCLAEIHREFVNYAYGRFRAIAISGDLPDVLLRRLIGELLNQVHDFRGEVVLLWDARLRLPASRTDEIESRKSDIRHFFKDAILEGQRQGQFHKSHDARVAALGVFGMCMWAYHWYTPGRGQTPQQIAHAFADLAVIGLSHSPSGPEGGAQMATSEFRLS